MPSQRVEIPLGMMQQKTRSPFVFQTGLRADPQQIAKITRIDGLPAGSAYPLSEPRVIA